MKKLGILVAVIVLAGAIFIAMSAQNKAVISYDGDRVRVNAESLENSARKLSTASYQIGQTKPEEILNLDISNLPKGFERAIPSEPIFEIVIDNTPVWSDGLPEFYVYMEMDQEWYGPFWLDEVID